MPSIQSALMKIRDIEIRGIVLILFVCVSTPIAGEPLVSRSEISDGPVAPELKRARIINSKDPLKVGISLIKPWAFCGKADPEQTVDETVCEKADPEQTEDETVECLYCGFEVAIARRVAMDFNGKEPKFVPVNWRDLISELLEGKFDVIISGMAITSERARYVNFSNPYMKSGIGLLVDLKEEKIQDAVSIDALVKDDLKLVVIEGTVSDNYAENVMKIHRDKLEKARSPSDVKCLLQEGHAHMFLGSLPLPNIISEELRGKLYGYVADKPLARYETGFSIAKPGDHDFLNYLNSWIVARQADGWIEEKRRKWLESLEWMHSEISQEVAPEDCKKSIDEYRETKSDEQ